MKFGGIVPWLVIRTLDGEVGGIYVFSWEAILAIASLRFFEVMEKDTSFPMATIKTLFTKIYLRKGHRGGF